MADPHDDDAQLRVHLVACHDCTQYTEQLLRFEGRLEHALRVAATIEGDRAPGPRAVEARTVRPRRSRHWLTAAASVLLAAVTAGGLWLAAPGPSLAADVVGHMAGEPDAWARTDVPVPQSKLDRVLSESRVRLKGDAGLVSYASSCLFRGHRVPHLVVQTEAGPVTVMVLTHERSSSRTRFDEHGYRGVIVPVPEHGSLAVLERGTAADLDAVDGIAARVRSAIEWTN